MKLIVLNLLPPSNLILQKMTAENPEFLLIRRESSNEKKQRTLRLTRMSNSQQTCKYYYSQKLLISSLFHRGATILPLHVTFQDTKCSACKLKEKVIAPQEARL